MGADVGTRKHEDGREAGRQEEGSTIVALVLICQFLDLMGSSNVATSVRDATSVREESYRALHAHKEMLPTKPSSPHQYE